MSVNKDKTYLYLYFENYGFSEKDIDKVIQNLSIRNKNFLIKCYGEDLKNSKLNKELTKKEKSLLYGQIFKLIMTELENNLKFTRKDLEKFKEIKQQYNITNWEYVIILFRFGYINNKRFSISSINKIINNKVSLENIKKILMDNSLINKFNEEIGNNLKEELMLASSQHIKR